MKISYNWLQSYFRDKLPEPEVISDGIIFHAFEVEEMEQIGEDTIFDIKVLPDRAHDCLSHFGIAKEISAIFNLEILPKDVDFKFDNLKSTNLQIEILDDNCTRYMGRIIRNVTVGESPDWLKERLNAIGQKSINNIVDIANFIMFDLGQPIHCFDLDKLESENIIIRKAKNGEKITTLDKKDVGLDESILVIADSKDPLAIAGIKGGTKAEVDKNTKNIVVEVANFNAVSVRKTARRINILTDAVKRYENELSRELCSIAMYFVTKMIFEISGGELEDVVDIQKINQDKYNINIAVDYINKRLGADFSKDEIRSVWDRLSFKYTEKDNEFDIEIPSLRLDLRGPHDLVEEVIRILGYERLEESIPNLQKGKIIDETYFKVLCIRKHLLDLGYSEVMTYVFRDKGDIEILASASDKKFLRNNLLDGLSESIKLNILNAPFLGMKEIKIFEIGTVFLKDREEIRVAFGNKKKVEEMTLDEYFSKFDGSRLPLSQDSMDYILGTNPLISNSNFKQWSPYPFIYRDIAVFVPNEINPEVLESIYRELGGNLLVKEPILIDKFSKENKISYAYRLVFQSYEKTLTDHDIMVIMDAIYAKIKESGFEIR